MPGRIGKSLQKHPTHLAGEDTMLTTLATLHSATSAHVDDLRRCIWVTQANGDLLRVDFAGGSSTVQTAGSPLLGVAGNGRALVFADQDGTISLLDPDDPGAPPKVVSRP